MVSTQKLTYLAFVYNDGMKTVKELNHNQIEERLE